MYAKESDRNRRMILSFNYLPIISISGSVEFLNLSAIYITLLYNCLISIELKPWRKNCETNFLAIFYQAKRNCLVISYQAKQNCLAISGEQA